MNSYLVRSLKPLASFDIEVPGSKSITNRALLLAAMGQNKCTLNGVLFSDDSRAFLSCLVNLGFNISIDEKTHSVIMEGTRGVIPNKKATINVGSAGTAARFLTVFLAFAGGEYTLNASDQMCKRPMEPLLTTLREAGVTINCLKEEGHFPFTMVSNGVSVSSMRSNTDTSSQFASAMLMSATLLPNGLEVILEGGRTHGAYINITLKMMEQFGISFERIGDKIKVEGGASINLTHYDIEPDVSAAGYFYALSPICHKTIRVAGVHLDSMQGDIKFIKLLTNLGCSLEETEYGLKINPPELPVYSGIDVNMNDYSDQTMTMAVVAAFASSPTTIRGIEHIRHQESDRLMAIITNLNNLGIKAQEIDNGDGIYIVPGPMHGAKIETFEDHRMAMAFTLIGFRTPNVEILNPMCCSKTFENYFDVIDSISL